MLQSHLERLDEGPQQSPDALPSAQKFDQTHHSEQTEEGDGDASAILCVLRWRTWRVIRGLTNIHTHKAHSFMQSVIHALF